MFEQAQEHYSKILGEIRNSGLWKEERVITSPQGVEIEVNGRRVLNFCANNYLGLANHPAVVAAARESLSERGYGMSSVRFICGTQDQHKELEKRLSEFVGMEETILYSSCFDANGGLFETLLGEQDAVISDALNHASIIDGVRLCKAQRFRYEHADMKDLEEKLKSAQQNRLRMIATDGVFSMDGDVAPLPQICNLAEKYKAMVMVDDSHATGFVGKKGRGSHEFHNCMNRVDIITSTLGKALGGATGGFTSSRKEIVQFLRNRSRPYLFSNTVAPTIVAASLAVVDLIQKSDDLRRKLEANTQKFRSGMTAAGFNIRPGTHPIVPIMLGEAKVATEMARRLLEKGIYVIGFSFPVVPEGRTRIRVQLSAAHSDKHIDQAVAAFTSVAREMGVVK
ncbi:MAG TPA: glycine C-acetyltransferase [Tepidisphaeraceae bacterium]|jgi:glycine C-acetyltransferase|nr:glycine C-acetyltransferase [Tepidisphaeraceae bacterium]